MLDKELIMNKKKEAEEGFEALRKQAGDLEAQAKQMAVEHERKSKEIYQAHSRILVEMNKFQGEYRAYEKLNGGGELEEKRKLKKTLDHQPKKKKK